MMKSNPTQKHRSAACPRHTSFLTLAFAIALTIAGAADADDFDTQRNAISGTLETQPEKAVRGMLETGLAEGKPSQAIMLAQKWMRQNQPESPEFYFFAGRAAELSGDWATAVALYQQFLKTADPMGPRVGEALTRACQIQSNYLRDVGAAFLFYSQHANRLVSNPTARKMDRWFLDIAAGRKDYGALAKRLRAVIESGISTDEIKVFYAKDFHVLTRWLFGATDTKVPTLHYVEIEKLAKTIDFDDELKLQLGAFAAVHAYFADKTRRKAATAPLEATEALLEHYPGYASALYEIWMGGTHHKHYDWKESWPDKVKEKMAQFTAAEARMSTFERASFLAAADPYRYGARKPNPFDSGNVMAHAKANPEIVGAKSAWHWRIYWRRLKREQINALATALSQNPSFDASAIRVIAASSDFDKAIALASGAEAWCLPLDEKALGTYVYHLWEWYGKPGGDKKRDRAVAALNAVRKQAKSYKPKQPAEERMKRFATLWADFTSESPTIPCVREQLVRLVRVTPEAIPVLLNDSSIAAQLLAKDMIDSGVQNADGYLSGSSKVRGLRTAAYDPSIRIKASVLGRYLRDDKAANRAHALEPVLREAVSARLAKGQITPWLTLAWVNAQFYGNNAEQHELAKKLVASPAFAKQPYEVRYGIHDWFKHSTMTAKQKALYATNSGIFNSVRKLPEKADLASVTKAFEDAVARMKGAPSFHRFGEGDHLKKIDRGILENAALQPLILELGDPMRWHGSASYLRPWLDTLRKESNPIAIHRSAMLFWAYAQGYSRHNSNGKYVLSFVESLTEKHPSAANALARCGLQIIDRHDGRNPWYDKKVDVPRLKAVRGKSAIKMGLVVIPVPPEHAAYPIYKSQADWLTGNEDSAWDVVDQNWPQLMENHRKLSVEYLNWLLRRVINDRKDARQEELLTALLSWSKERTSPLSADDKINLELAYGDVAVQNGRLTQALSIFSGISANKAYDGRMLQHQAALRKVRVQRLARNFDGALETLTELAHKRIPELVVPLRCARAETYYDMEDYDSANEEISAVLARQPSHPEAILLEGRVRLQRMQLMEATELEIGSTSEVEQLVPGENLKVTLSDPTLTVAGAGTEIEVEVWTTTGDKEVFMLRRFGDNKSKFRGEVKTVLGKAVPGDNMLQVVGDDKVYYDYSESFRKRVGNLEENRGGPITIASDGILFASARQLLSVEEQRSADAEASMANIADGDAVENGEAKYARISAQKRLAAQAEAQLSSGGTQEDTKSFGHRATGVARVKPGNVIHVRVVDPDRSRTGEVDELAVSLSSTSGDRIGRVVLKEVNTHSGWFEGQVKTAPSQATVSASSSETGRNPNAVISPLDTHPAWRPASTQQAPFLTVDLAKYAAVDTLKIRAAEANSRLPAFVVHTGVTSDLMAPVASYPHTTALAKNPWLPTFTIVSEDRPRSVTAAREYLEAGWLLQSKITARTYGVSGPSQALPNTINEEWRKKAAAVVYRFQAHFYEPRRTVQRRFALKLGPYKYKPSSRHRRGDAQFLLVVDGKVLGSRDKLEGSVTLTRGAHVVEVWATGWLGAIGFGRSMNLQANLGEENAMIDCPDAFFAPKNLPDAHAPAKVTANAAKTEFTVSFAPGTRTRFLRITTPKPRESTPAITKLLLTGADGKQVLPLTDDFAALSKNDVLEVQAGDQISVRYLDDRFVTSSKARHERFLSVGYTDGMVSLGRTKPMPYGGKGTYHQPALRFVLHEPLSARVEDADMDVTNKPDQVKVSIAAAGGEEKTFMATETGNATGIFEVTFTPVSGKPNKDQIRVGKNGALTATYVDAETINGAVGAERKAKIGQAVFVEPEMQLSHATVEALDSTAARSVEREAATRVGAERRRASYPSRLGVSPTEQLPARWQVTNQLFPTNEPPEAGITFIQGQKAYLQLRAPNIALSEGAGLTIYAQTESGRRAAGIDNNAPFNLDVPGTIKVRAQLLKSLRRVPVGGNEIDLPIYHTRNKHAWLKSKLADQLFVAEFAVKNGVLPEHGILPEKKLGKNESRPPAPALIAKPSERLYLGYRYRDSAGQERWLTTNATSVTHPVLDVMQEDYRSARIDANVGESLYFRVVDLGGDSSDQRDIVSVFIQAKSGAKHRLELRETGPHTGVFKGNYTLGYRDGAAAETEDYDVRRQGVPVLYGDKIGVRYTSPSGVKTPAYYLTIRKGANGRVKPFSKKYADEEMAMKTQFSLAESHLELAKRHRQNGNLDIANHDYDRAKQLLSKAMEQFRDPETRAKALYLLGNLTLEEAIGATDPAVAKTRYKAALSRFMDVTSSYPSSLIASQAQFRIASVYERLDEHDVAAQQYVKLAYKYPDSEYLALSMAKLGTYFNRNAKKYEMRSKKLLADVDDKEAQIEGQATQKMAELEYVKAAQIFGRVLKRFPDHTLAGKAGLRSGQAYYRAKRYDDALEAFLPVLRNKSYDALTVRSQAMYWAGDCYSRTGQLMAAFSTYKRLTYDFPETQWASYARAKLSESALAGIEKRLAIQRLEEGR